jgi:uncharacterized protein (TIGR00730 family)
LAVLPLGRVIYLNEYKDMSNKRGAKPLATSIKLNGGHPARLIQNICVYCGSGHGAKPIYAEAARTLGQSLAANGIGLVYGGGSLGLMGEVARSTLDAGGRVIGIIPEFLSEKEKMLTDADELIVTKDMHERKQLMFLKSDAFVALPGGIGTLEELVEQLTWSQLGRHEKPIIVADIGGFWSPFLNLLAHMKEDAFIRSGLDVHFSVVGDAANIVPAALAAVERKGEIDPGIAVAARF